MDKRVGLFMNKKSGLIIIIIISIILQVYAFGREKERSALKLHIDSIVVDTHNDTMMKIIDEETWMPVTDIRNNTNNHIDIPKMRAGNLQVGFFAAFTTPYNGDAQKSLSRTLALLNALYWTADNNSDIFSITPGYDHIESSVLKRKIAAVPSIEGAYSITKETYPQLLYQYEDLGIRMIAPTWNYSNELGEGAYGQFQDKSKTKSQGGLTELGEEMIREMNRLGIIVDVSHLNERSFWDVVRVTKAPIVASHSGVYALRPHVRNLKDDQLKAIADSNGIVSLVMYRDFVKSMDDAYIKDFVDHIDYAVNLMGIDHVGIGSDFDGADMPFDMKDASHMYKITQELVHRNYSDGDIQKILGKNILRVIRETEELSEKVQYTDVEIIPGIKMGEILEGNKEFLKAEINLPIGKSMDDYMFRIILNGKDQEVLIDYASNTIGLSCSSISDAGFHVITFEAMDTNGVSNRETQIFIKK